MPVVDTKQTRDLPSRRNTPVSAQRKRAFLKVLRETGSMSAAAVAASPSCRTRSGALASIRTAAHLDPHFAQQIEDAKSEAIGRVEQLIMERALTPDERPVFSKGELKGFAKDHRGANQMLLRVAESLAPERWAPKKNLSGEIAHTHEHSHASGAVFVLEPRHILMLAEEEQDLLLGLLGRLRDQLGEEEPDVRRRLPEPTADDDAREERPHLSPGGA